MKVVFFYFICLFAKFSHIVYYLHMSMQPLNICLDLLKTFLLNNIYRNNLDILKN